MGRWGASAGPGQSGNIHQRAAADRLGGHASGAAEGFGFQQHIQRIGQARVVPAIGLGLEGLFAQEMDRRTQLLDRVNSK